MNPSKKVFVVVEYDEDFVDNITTFPTKEMAEQYTKEKFEKDLVPKEIYKKVTNEVNLYLIEHPNSFKDYFEFCHEINSDYSIEQYMQSDDYYEFTDSYFIIVEGDYYE